MTALPALRSLHLHELATFSVPGLLKIRVEGHAALPREGPILLLANRCSLLDPWLLSLAAGRAVQVGATSPLFWLPGMGDLAARLNTVPLIPPGEEADPRDEPRAFAGALERYQPVAMFGDLALQERPEGARYGLDARFIDVLLATHAERIPVVPLVARGQGWKLRLHQNPLLAPLFRAGSRVVDTPYPQVLYTENTLRVGRPVYWRDGAREITLEEFRREVELSLGALI
jgi:1-acyl-sn-glycerol-3-phosphate acyltransferase